MTHTIEVPEVEWERLQAENRKLRDILQWTNDQCPGKCAAVCDEALREKPSPLVDELILLRSEQARLMTQLEEARRELRGVMRALPVTTVAFTGDYGLYVRSCIEHLRQEHEPVKPRQ